jgi:glycerol uptake facilitator-like aquaporin
MDSSTIGLRLGAEALGTFLFFFLGFNAIAVSVDIGAGAISNLGIAFAFGLGLVLAIGSDTCPVATSIPLYPVASRWRGSSQSRK